MSQIAVADGSLIFQEQAMDFTVRQFITEVFGEPLDGDFRGPESGLMAEVICTMCARHLEPDENCPSHDVGVSIVIDDKLLELKLREFTKLAESLSEYEQTVLTVLFKLSIYKMSGGGISSLEAAEAVVLAEILGADA